MICRRSATGDGVGQSELFLDLCDECVFGPSHTEHSEGMQIYAFDTSQWVGP
jgi:hypothetical protein